MEKQHEMEIVEQAFTLLDKEELTDAIVDEVFGLLGKVFDEDCLKQIQWGFENGLTPEQVGVYAKQEFDWVQMYEICKGFEHSLSMEQVSVYAKPELRSDQMRRIRAGFEHDLSMEQVSVYAKPEFTWDQMEQVFFGFIDRLSMEQVAVYAKPEFTREQMKQIREGFEQGLSMEEVSALIKKPSLAKKIMAAKKSRGRLRAKNRKRARVMRSWRNKNRIKGEIMNVLFFTGAGISKDSGVPTFQEIDGIRTKLRRKYAALHPAEIRDMMREFKGFMKDKEPNAAHVAIAKAGFPVITMNVDELHQRAGSKDVLAIHGDIPSEEELGKWYYPYLPLGKPVLYGNIAPRYYKAFAKLRSLREGDYLVIVGTSFYTNISKDIRKMAEKRGAKVISINENATVEVPRVCEELLRKVEEGGKSYGTRNKKCT